MAILDVLKLIAKKAKQGQQLTDSERAIVRRTTAQDLAEAEGRGAIDESDREAIVRALDEGEERPSTGGIEVRDEPAEEITSETRLRSADELSDAEREFEADQQTPPPRGGGPTGVAGAGAVAAAGSEESEAEEEGPVLKNANQLQADLRRNPPTVRMDEESPFTREQFEQAEAQSTRETTVQRLPERYAKDAAFYTSFLRLTNQLDDEQSAKNTYLSVRDSLARGEISPEMTALQEIIEENERQLDRGVAETILLSAAPDEEKAEIAEGLRFLREAGRPQPRALDAKFVDESASMDDDETNTGASIQDNRLRTAEEIRTHNRELGQLLSTTADEMDEDDTIIDDVRDFIEIVTPFVEQSDLWQIASESGLLDFGPVDAVLFGSFKRKLANEITNISDPDQREQAVRKLIRIARNKSGATPMSENEIAMMVELQGVLQSGGPTTGEVVLDNVIGILDFVMVGQILGRLARGVRGGRSVPRFKGGEPAVEPVPVPERLPPPETGTPGTPKPERAAKPRYRYRGEDPRTGKPRWKLRLDEALGSRRGTPFDNATRSNPGVGGRLGAAAMADDTGNFADALGTTREDIAFDIYPKPFEYTIDGASPRVTKFLEFLNRHQQTVFRETESLGGMLTEAEKAIARRQYWDNLDKVGGGLKHHTAKGRMHYNEEGVEARAVFGPNEDHGFLRFADAESTRAFKFGADDPDSQILFHDVRTGDVRPVTESDVDELLRTDEETGITIERFSTARGKEEIVVNDPEGNTIVNIEGVSFKDGTVSIENITAMGGRGSVGSTNIRAISRLLKRQFPAAVRIVGDRVSGTRAAAQGVDALPERGGIFASVDISNINTALPGEFYVQRDFRVPYDRIAGPVFRSNPVQSNMPARFQIALMDASSRFADFIRLGAFTGAENAALIERRVIKELSRIWPNASKRQKNRLTEALMQGDKEQKRYTAYELHSQFGLDQNGIDGYFGMRTSFDFFWNLQNRDMRRAMLDQDFDRWMVSPEFGESPVRIYDDADDAIRAANAVLRELDVNDFDAINAVTGDPIRITPEVLRGMYERNEGTLVELYQRSYSERGVDKFAFIPKSDAGTTVEIRALPSKVMPYREGHVPRFYEANHFVIRRIKSPRVNGRRPSDTAIKRGDFDQAIGAAKTRKGADRTLDNLMREAEEAAKARPDGGDLDKYEFFVRPDRSRSRSRAERTQRDWEVMTSRALTGQRRRGSHLRTASDTPEVDYINAEIDDPWNAFMRTAKAVSRHVSNNQVLAHLKRRFLSTYGDMTGGVIPRSARELEELARANNVNNPKRVRDAVSFRQYLDLLDRMPNAAGFDQRWHEAMYSIADNLPVTFKQLPESVEQTVRSAGNLNASQKLKSTAFTMYLALNPQRQFFVQSGQLLQLAAVEPRYVYSGALFRDIQAVTVGALARGHGGRVYDGAAEIGAKMMGVSPDEYKRILDALIERSGIPWNIDQHLLVNAFTDPYSSGAALKPEFYKQVPQRAIRGGDRIVQIGKQVGFDAGELVNVTGSWLAGRRKWLRENPDKVAEWDSITNLREVNLLGRELSWSMIHPGRFVWQDGMISALLQFMSIPTKALLNGTSSNVLSRVEKARFWTNNIAFLGLFSIPLVGEMMDRGLQELMEDEPPQRVRQMLQGGFVDVMANIMADMAFNERHENDLLVAEDFSPLAQTSDNYVRTVESLDKPVLRMLAENVPGIAAFSRLVDVSQSVYGVLEATKYDQYETEEGLIRAMKSLSTISSGMSNYWKMRAALDLERAVSNSGSLNLETAKGEAFGILFGVQSADERDYWDTVIGEYDRRGNIRDDAEFIYDFWMQQEVLMGSGTMEDRQIRATTQALETVFGPYPEEDREFVLRELNRLNRQRRESGEQHLYGLILERLASTRGYGGMEGVEGIKKMIHGEALPEPMKESLLDFVDRAYKPLNTDRVDQADEGVNP